MTSVLELNKIEEGEHKHPHKVDEVPVQSDLLHHFVVAPALIHAGKRIVEDQKVKTYATEHVEAVEAGDKEKEVGKCGRPILILVKVRANECITGSHRRSV